MENNPKSLADLFAEDPLNLTDADVDQMTAAMRKARANWVAEETSARAQGRKPNPASANIKLDDLDI
jgi:hypothetical protein